MKNGNDRAISGLVVWNRISIEALLLGDKEGMYFNVHQLALSEVYQVLN
ncbi:hypothetical protein ACVR0P_05485 [Streptococcus castoreus]|nr:hypothetical protein [Streptococcus castoreus]